MALKSAIGDPTLYRIHRRVFMQGLKAHGPELIKLQENGFDIISISTPSIIEHQMLNNRHASEWGREMHLSTMCRGKELEIPEPRNRLCLCRWSATLCHDGLYACETHEDMCD
jgi:hypothetical protein